MSKYYKLTEYLDNINEDKVTLSPRELSEILGFPLPKSALIHSAWWANDDISHSQSKSWNSVGWITTEVILGESVTFVKS